MIFFEREYVHLWAWVGKGQKERKRILSRLYTQHGAYHGAQSHELWDHDLSWNQESDAYLIEPPMCPNDLVLKKCKVSYDFSIVDCNDNILHIRD